MTKHESQYCCAACLIGRHEIVFLRPDRSCPTHGPNQGRVLPSAINHEALAARRAQPAPGAMTKHEQRCAEKLRDWLEQQMRNAAELHELCAASESFHGGEVYAYRRVLRWLKEHRLDFQAPPPENA